MTRKISIAVLGMGWMGHVHTRAWRAACHRYPELDAEIELVACADANAELAIAGAAKHGFKRHTSNWEELVNDASIDAVSVTTPNFLHAEICIAAAAAGKHIWCEKPVGRNAQEACRAADAADAAKVASLAGFNYHFVPLVQHTRELLVSGELGEVEMFRGRFYSMFAYDRLGLHSWRFRRDAAGAGVAGDLLSHVIDMAMYLAGPMREVCGQQAVFIPERPLPKVNEVSHYARGKPGDPMAPVENEDYASALVRFASGALGSIESWRTACGPKSDMGFELYCTNGSVKWCLERMNELQIFLRDHGPLDGYTRVLAGERHPEHSRFNPGDGNGLGYEDTKTIEAAKLLDMIVNGETELSELSSLRHAAQVAQVTAAVLLSCDSGKWEKVLAT